MLRALARGVVVETVAIPGGRFDMGSFAGRPDEQPVHPVEVGAFRVGRTAVTRAQYAPFLSAGLAALPPWWDAPGFDAPDQPVVGVTWHDASAFADWLTPVSGSAWRLPTEAEWERAMRGGLVAAPTAWGASVPAAEIPEGPLVGPWRVGQGTPNAFGVCDPGTVVHEWCADWYGAEYYAVCASAGAPASVDPRGPEEGERRASRGGSWRHRIRWSPPSARSSLPPDLRYADYGFRLVCGGLRQEN